MTVQLELIENGHVLHYVFTDPVDMRELEAFNRQEKEYYDVVTHRIHSLVDIRQMTHVPQGALHVRIRPNLTHKNSGHLVLVGASTLIRMLAETATRLAHFGHIEFFSEIDPAWAYLRDLIAKGTSNSAAAPTGDAKTTPDASPKAGL